MQDFQQRVIDERAELVKKLDKLSEFLKDDVFKHLPEFQRELLTRQHVVMQEYASVLAQRIAHFGKASL